MKDKINNIVRKLSVFIFIAAISTFIASIGVLTKAQSKAENITKNIEVSNKTYYNNINRIDSLNHVIDRLTKDVDAYTEYLEDLRTQVSRQQSIKNGR